MKLMKNLTMSLEYSNVVPNKTAELITRNDRNKSDHEDSSSQEVPSSRQGPCPTTTAPTVATCISTVQTVTEGTVEGSDSNNSIRERLKRHRDDVAGRVWIPEMWGQDSLLKDWIDCTAFDSSLASNSAVMSARASLIEEGRRANAMRLKIAQRC